MEEILEAKKKEDKISSPVFFFLCLLQVINLKKKIKYFPH